MKKSMQQTSYYSRTDGVSICTDCVHYRGYLNCPYVKGTALPVSCEYYVSRNSEEAHDDN